MDVREIARSMACALGLDDAAAARIADAVVAEASGDRWLSPRQLADESHRSLRWVYNIVVWSREAGVTLRRSGHPHGRGGCLYHAADFSRAAALYASPHPKSGSIATAKAGGAASEAVAEGVGTRQGTPSTPRPVGAEGTASQSAGAVGG